LSSGLQHWYLLEDAVQATAFRSRQKYFEEFFITQVEINAFKNVECLMSATNIRHKLEEWQLFIDSSMHGLKAVLLHM
jgi:hypothetical protein